MIDPPEFSFPVGANPADCQRHQRLASEGMRYRKFARVMVVNVAESKNRPI
jgi:hypothetical protein